MRDDVLGQPLQYQTIGTNTYKAPVSACIGAGLLGVGGGTFAILFALVLVFGVRHEPNDGGMALLFDLVFALPAGLLGLFLMWRFAELCAVRVTTHPDGIDFHGLTQRRHVAWSDIAAIRRDSAREPNILVIVLLILLCWYLLIPYILSRVFPRLRHSLTLKNGTRIRIPRNLAHKDSLVDIIDSTLARLLLPDVFDRFQRGVRCEFGAFVVETDGLYAGKKMLPWHDIQSVTTSGQNVFVFRNAEQRPWTSARMKAVPNPTLLTALVRKIREGTPSEGDGTYH